MGKNEGIEEDEVVSKGWLVYKRKPSGTEGKLSITFLTCLFSKKTRCQLVLSEGFELVVLKSEGRVQKFGNPKYFYSFLKG